MISTFKIQKDAAADLDYSIDWTQWLTDPETIASSTWTVDSGSGLTMHNAGLDVTSKIATVWLSGGTDETGPWAATNSIVTNSSPPRHDERSILLTIVVR